MLTFPRQIEQFPPSNFSVTITSPLRRGGLEEAQKATRGIPRGRDQQSLTVFQLAEQCHHLERLKIINT